ncbi:MAG TPA: DNA methyltransferase, partial [Longimicrobiales bacterium]|nr:DNA methyltransferase [Longimicrobiales bacterium]
METTTRDVRTLITTATSRGDVLRLVEWLGFTVALQPIPRAARGAWGLADAPELKDALVAGTAGSLDALLLELRDTPSPDVVSRLCRGVRKRNPVRLHLFVLVGPACEVVVLGAFDEEGGFRHLWLEKDVRESDVEALEEMAARPGEEGLVLATRQLRALDRGRVTDRFFRDFRARREAVARAWRGVPVGAERERRQLALLFLCRLTFLYFIQRRGALGGDERFIASLLGRWLDEPGQPAATFFRARLQPLFFGALNRRPEDRDPSALALGALPYLNGGLFDRHHLERQFPELDLPDDEARGVIEGLLERYRFTSREGGEGAGFGVDPEILGRVFEGLMAPGRRGETGSFYTPAPVVNRVVREAVAEYLGGRCGLETARRLLDEGGEAISGPDRRRARSALERVRVLDPACGSGAFLLGALWRLTETLGAVKREPAATLRRDVVAGALHGVDLLDEAALLCSLRLWLALSAGEKEIRPLPNLDRRIRQGDALVDPLDLRGLMAGDPHLTGVPRTPELRVALRDMEPAGRRYLDSGPEDRDGARGELARRERALARAWVGAAERSARFRLRQLRAAAGERDLFGEVPDRARRAAARLGTLEERLGQLEAARAAIRERGSLPFFSFGVHFSDAAGGFDLIVSNPPWIRSHRWPDRLRALARHFEVCRSPGWRRGIQLAGAPSGVGAQVDLSLLFLERAVRLLAPAGVLAMLVPAKTFRALYGGAARRLLLRELEVACIEDHALDHRSMFRADTYAGVLIGRRPTGQDTAADLEDPEVGAVRVQMVRRGVPPLRFRLPRAELPLFPGDLESPWLLAPPDVVRGIRTMQRAGPPLGADARLRVRRGIMTGRNDVLVMADVEPKLGGLARVEAEGARRATDKRAAGRYRAFVEMRQLRPLIRGAGIDAFRYRTDGYVVWCRDGEGRHEAPAPRMARY